MPGFQKDQLPDVISSEQFGNNVVQAGDYTTDTDQESAHAVYQDRNGVVSYSEVLHPDTEYLEALEAAEAMREGLTPGQVLDHILRMLEGTEEPEGLMPELSLGRLIMGDMGVRTDLATVTHTHPVTHLGRRKLLALDQIIMPSRRDVVNFADHAAANDGIIEAVQVSSPDIPGGIGLLMMRKTREDSLQRIQGMDTSSGITLQRLADLGLSYTLVGFDRHTGRVRHGMRHLHRLYEEPTPLTLAELLR